MSKPKSDQSTKNPKPETYWQFVERTAKEVEAYPPWKLGGTSSRQDPPSTKGDKKDLK